MTTGYWKELVDKRSMSKSAKPTKAVSPASASMLEAMMGGMTLATMEWVSPSKRQSSTKRFMHGDTDRISSVEGYRIKNCFVASKGAQGVDGGGCSTGNGRFYSLIQYRRKR